MKKKILILTITLLTGICIGWEIHKNKKVVIKSARYLYSQVFIGKEYRLYKAYFEEKRKGFSGCPMGIGSDENVGPNQDCWLMECDGEVRRLGYEYNCWENIK